MARGEVLVSLRPASPTATCLKGVRFAADAITTHTIVMRSSSLTVREIKARHQDLDKFD
jgi:fructose-1,6-bisphosphatase II / sedoheptulose-1,7-bisphosphatase